jgi:HEAT repeat protein
VSTASVPTRDPERPELPFPSALVEELLKVLVKAVRAHQLYLQNNPVYQRSIELLRGAFEPIWAQATELVLSFTESEIRWMDRPVLVEHTKSTDSLPWLFFKDGVREISVQRGFEIDELPKLLDIILRAKRASAEEDDLLTMLWEQDFTQLRYRYVDLAVEAAPPLEGEPPPELRESPAPIETAAPEQPREGVVRMEDFDATLYFLDEKEIDYLRTEVKQEYESDLRQNVLAILLDIFEHQGDPAVRGEIADILDNFMVLLLSVGQLRAVAYLLHETTASVKRIGTLAPAHRDRLALLPHRLSAPEPLSQLLQSLDQASDLPPQEDLSHLFAQLQPRALATVFLALDRLTNEMLRPLLEAAAGRLASQHTAELVKLIGAEDETVAMEAIRRAAAIKSPAVVAPLGKVLADRPAPLRLAAVQALNEIASPGALQALERGIDDEDRDVRVATVRAIAARQHKPALPRLEGAVKTKEVRDADLTEKMAFFEVYGTLCGDSGVAYLAELLNGKGFLGRREDPELRACAAMALGKIGTPRALEALRIANNEKEVLVRNAVNRALRGGAA